MGAAVAAGVLLSVGSAAQPAGARAERPRVALRSAAPVVVELFTAQGCGGCVDANLALERAADEPGVTRLGEWRGRPVLYALPDLGQGEAVAILVQAKADRRILGAAVRH
jgi:hypothetical protein